MKYLMTIIMNIITIMLNKSVQQSLLKQVLTNSLDNSVTTSRGQPAQFFKCLNRDILIYPWIVQKPSTNTTTQCLEFL